MSSSMHDYSSIFTGKKITQMGLGLLGRGVGDADFLAKAGAELLVTDLKDETALVPSCEKLRRHENITFHLSGHEHVDFKERDLVLKGAGVPLKNEYIQTARESGVPVDMSASLFARIARIPMIGVTGTRGKSTVTHLLHDVLVADGRDMLLGGNVKGVSNLALLASAHESSMGIFELDSWQCQGFGEEKSIEHPLVQQGPHSPAIAVFTTFMPDHLNYYKGDMDAYLRDKVNIFTHQDSAHVLVIGRQAVPALELYKKDIRANVIIADETDVPKSWNTKLVGAHNRYNIGVAVATARTLGVDDETIERVVATFAPMPGRMEYVTAKGGVGVYNDTNATTPDATVTALEALSENDKGNTVLIAGGADKGLDQEVLARAIAVHAKHVVLLPGKGTDALCGALEKTENSTKVDTLKEAVKCAFEHATEGDSIVLSPGCASFGLFQNEYDRGEQFVSVVKRYGK